MAFPQIPEADQRYRLREMQDRHYTMMHLVARGWRNVEIARELNMSVSRVSVVVNSPIFKAELAKYRDQLRTELVNRSVTLLEKGAPKAAAFLVHTLSPKSPVSPAIKSGNAKFILERVTPPQEGKNGSGESGPKIVVNVGQVNVTDAMSGKERSCQEKTKLDLPLALRGEKTVEVEAKVEPQEKELEEKREEKKESVEIS